MNTIMTTVLIVAMAAQSGRNPWEQFYPLLKDGRPWIETADGFYSNAPQQAFQSWYKSQTFGYGGPVLDTPRTKAP